MGASAYRMLTERHGERLPDWFHAVRQDDLPCLHTLAAAIDRDRDAVIAGPTLPWGSGAVEGRVHRIKVLEREMFGRAGFDLLPPAQASPAGVTQARDLPLPRRLYRLLIQVDLAGYAIE